VLDDSVLLKQTVAGLTIDNCLFLIFDLEEMALLHPTDYSPPAHGSSTHAT